MSKVKLKAYQKNILNLIKKGKKGIMFIPTSLGKEVINLNDKSLKL